ncbi:MAG: redoxin domain-containing protein [Pseudomonadales bacterium]|jgi:peroxiredoxin
MSDTPTTYDIAEQQLAEYVQPIEAGALAMPFDVKDEDGRNLKLVDDHLSGKYLILIFLNDVSDNHAIQILKHFAGHHSLFDELNATLVTFSSDSDANKNQQLKKASAYSWPIAGDSTGAVFASYGLHKGNCANVRIVVLTPFRQIRGWTDDPENIDHTIRGIMDILKSGTAHAEASWTPPHAPILMIPNVLSRAECTDIISSFETGGPFTVRPPRAGEFSGDYKIPVYEHNRQDRVDHIIKDKNTISFLDNRIWSRITPMIQKAFAYEVTRREDLHIARYVGERGGNQMGHRDNTSPATAYRRFALSLNLNDNYEGGGIAFKEYSQKPYNSPPGTAIVFSSALLHEVLETTKGTRYTLISHFFNDQGMPPKK